MLFPVQAAGRKPLTVSHAPAVRRLGPLPLLPQALTRELLPRVPLLGLARQQQTATSTQSMHLQHRVIATLPPPAPRP